MDHNTLCLEHAVEVALSRLHAVVLMGLPRRANRAALGLSMNIPRCGCCCCWCCCRCCTVLYACPLCLVSLVLFFPYKNYHTVLTVVCVQYGRLLLAMKGKSLDTSPGDVRKQGRFGNTGKIQTPCLWPRPETAPNRT